MTYENLKSRLENIQWRAEEGLKGIDVLFDIIDRSSGVISEEEYNKAINAYIDLKDAWLGGINMNVSGLISDLEETKES